MDNQMNNGGFNTEIKNEIKGRGLFYGVIAVATFIVMAVGATFAYFTATTNSANTAVQTGSTTLELEYISYETAWMSGDLIPASTATVVYSFEKQNDTTLRTGENINENANLLCRDDYGNSICSVYVFQVKNTAASPQTLALNVVSELNEFESLYAMAFEVSKNLENNDYDSTEDGNSSNDPKFKIIEPDGEIEVVDGNGLPVSSFDPLYVNRKGVIKTQLKYNDTITSQPLIQVLDRANNTDENIEGRTANIANGFEIEGGKTKTYALVLYILNQDKDQTSTDAKKNFSGQVVITSGDGTTGVSGYIHAVEHPEDTPEEEEEKTEDPAEPNE